jgi:hypothetical protein
MVPGRSFLPGGATATIELNNFLIVSTAADITVKFSEDVLDPRAQQISVVFSDSEVTVIAFLIPPGSEGLRQVSVFPNALPTNLATTEFLYEDNTPILLSASPYERYKTGGDEVTLELSNFGGVGLTPVNARISVGTLSADATFAAYDSARKISTLRFTAPAQTEAGQQKVIVEYIEAEDATGPSTLEAIYLNYVTVPAGAASLMLTPTSGKQTGGFVVYCQLTNFQMLTGADLKASVTVTYGGSRVPAADILSATSNTQATRVSFTAPAMSVGAVTTVRVAGAVAANAGESAFTITDMSAAVDSYNPSTGDSESDTFITVTVSNFLQVIQLPKDLSVSVTSSVTGLWNPTVNAILGTSTSERCIVEILLPKNELILTEDALLTFSLNPQGATSARKTATFTFTHLKSGSPRVSSFKPSVTYSDGGPTMTVELANVPEIIGAAGVSVLFGKLTSPALSFERVGETGAKLTLAIPGWNETSTFTVAPVLKAGSITAVFPAAFQYLDASSIMPSFPEEILPNSAFNTDATVASLRVENFPGVGGIADVIIKVGNAPDDRIATVRSYAQADAKLDVKELQAYIFAFEIPIGEDIPAGEAEIKVYHSNYEARFSIAPFKFLYKEVGVPSVTTVIGRTKEGEEVPDRAQMSVATEVTVQISSAPTKAQGVGDVAITMATSDTTSESIRVDDLNIVPGLNGAPATGTIKCLFPVSSSSGSFEVTIVFMKRSRLTAKFAITYYNDLEPRLVSVLPNTGLPEGNLPVVVTISNFPIVASTADVSVVLPGDGGVEYPATVYEVIKSTDAETVLRILTPLLAGLTPGSTRTLGLKVTPITQPNLETESTCPSEKCFTYAIPPIELDADGLSTQKLEGLDLGGNLIQIKIFNFRNGATTGAMATAGDVMITFGNTRVTPTLGPTSAEETIFNLVVPAAPQLGALTVDVTIGPTSSPQSTPQLGFTYTYFDSRDPKVLNPPLRGCSNEEHSISLWIELLPAGTAVGNIAIDVRIDSSAFFGAASCMNEAESCPPLANLTQAIFTVPMTGIEGMATVLSR